MQTNTDQQNFEAFAAELTKLSQRYGVILDCIGGVSFVDPTDECLKSLRYTSDASSGDLESLFK